MKYLRGMSQLYNGIRTVLSMPSDAPENLRKFLESDDPAIVRMGISLAKGADVEISAKDLENFLKHL